NQQAPVTTPESMPFGNQQAPVTTPESMPFDNQQAQTGTTDPLSLGNQQAQTGTTDPLAFGNQTENQGFGSTPMYGQGDMNNWNNNMAPNFNVDEKPAKKLPKKLLLICLPVALVVVAILCNLSSIAGFCVKTFGSDSDYLRYVEVNDLKAYCDSASTIYDAYLLENADMKVGQTADVAFELTDEGISMIEDLAGDELDIDLEWLKDIKLSLESNVDVNQDVKANMKIAGKDIASLAMVNDIENEMMYIAIPELSEKYLGIEIPAEDVSKFMETANKLEKVLPSEKELNKLLKKYLKVAFDSISDAEQSKGTLEAGDLSKKCTTVEIQIDDRLLLEMANNILEEAKNDKELKKIVTDFVALMAETDEIYEDIDVEEIFSDDIEIEQEDILEKLDDLDGDGEVYATLVDYIDGSHEIIGRALLVNDEEVVKYAMITKGGKFAFELNADEQVVITGSGKKNSKTITGDFVVTYFNEYVDEEQEVLTFSLDKFNTKKMENGELEGTVTVGLGSLIESIIVGNGSSSDSAAAGKFAKLLDLSLSMTFDSGSKGGTTSFALLSESEKLASVTATTAIKNPSKISAPDSAKVVEVTEDDPEAVTDYIDTVDISKIVNNLAAAGVPDEIIDAVELAVDEAINDMDMNSLSGIDSYDDYSDFDYEDFDYEDFDIQM
ncbi:MAG: nucleoporin, partial [Acutalibacteraceae bacterium]|nr:nucleoporin [Acutalibacteraceae bacterium]